MDAQGQRRHGQKGEQIDRLRHMLRHAAENSENGNKHRSAAHPHTAENAAGDPRRQPDKKAHDFSSLKDHFKPCGKHYGGKGQRCRGGRDLPQKPRAEKSAQHHAEPHRQKKLRIE